MRATKLAKEMNRVQQEINRDPQHFLNMHEAGKSIVEIGAHTHTPINAAAINLDRNNAAHFAAVHAHTSAPAIRRFGVNNRDFLQARGLFSQLVSIMYAMEKVLPVHQGGIEWPTLFRLMYAR